MTWLDDAEANCAAAQGEIIEGAAMTVVDHDMPHALRLLREAVDLLSMWHPVDGVQPPAEVDVWFRLRDALVAEVSQ